MPADATPLSDEAKAGLIPDYINTLSELNELEQQNIQKALIWLGRQKIKPVLEPGFLFELHRRMFGDVWKWAGILCSSGTNLGVDQHKIAEMLAYLRGDLRFWLENHTYPMDEIAARFHHRLVQIHPFENGNGRISRLMTDLLLEQNEAAVFSWGMIKFSGSPEKERIRRENYIRALKFADDHDYSGLLDFVRS